MNVRVFARSLRPFADPDFPFRVVPGSYTIGFPVSLSVRNSLLRDGVHVSIDVSVRYQPLIQNGASGALSEFRSAKNLS
jgi:hypothetical protein